MKPRFAILALAFLALGAWLLMGWADRDERAVRKQFLALVKVCEKTAGQNLLRTAANASALPAFFTTNALVHLGRPYPMTASPRELSALLARAHMEVESLAIGVQGMEFPPRTDPYAVQLRVAIELSGARNGQYERYLDEYLLVWRKERGAWRIAEARVDSAIQPP